MGRYGVHHNTKEIKYSIGKRTDNRIAPPKKSLEVEIIRRIARRINGSEGTSKKNKNEDCGSDTRAMARQWDGC